MIPDMAQVLFNKVKLSTRASVHHFLNVAQMIFEARWGVAVRCKPALTDIGTSRFASTVPDVAEVLIIASAMTTSAGVSDVQMLDFQVP